VTDVGRPRIRRAVLHPADRAGEPLGQQGAFRNVVLLNAAAALLVAGKAKTLREGVALAGQSIDSGKARAVLEALVKLSHAKV